MRQIAVKLQRHRPLKITPHVADARCRSLYRIMAYYPVESAEYVLVLSDSSQIRHHRSLVITSYLRLLSLFDLASVPIRARFPR
jgi:hypothetical protein